MNPSRTFQITKPKLLLGEGIDDENFLRAIVKTVDATDIQVANYGGKNNLRSYLKALALIPGFDELESLGVTRDADGSYSSALQSVQDAIDAQNFMIKSVTFILPDCTNSGMLEDLCISTLSSGEAQCIDQYLQCIDTVQGTLPTNLAKAKMYAWLAVQEKPEVGLGEAALNGYFDFNHPAFTSLKDFIRTL